MVILMGFSIYPLVNIQKAIENGPVEIVDIPSYSSHGDRSIVFWDNVYSRGSQAILKSQGPVASIMEEDLRLSSAAGCRSAGWNGWN